MKNNKQVNCPVCSNPMGYEEDWSKTHVFECNTCDFIINFSRNSLRKAKSLLKKMSNKKELS